MSQQVILSHLTPVVFREMLETLAETYTAMQLSPTNKTTFFLGDYIFYWYQNDYVFELYRGLSANRLPVQVIIKTHEQLVEKIHEAISNTDWENQ